MNSRIVAFALIPLVSALIGWLTNYIAVRMIFRPRRPMRICGFTVMGLIPRRKADLARKIGETVEKELISHRDIHQVVDSPEFRDQVIDAVIRQIEQFVFRTLGANPLVAVLLTGDIATAVKDMIRTELRERLPDVMEDLFERIEAKIDFKEIIRNKIEGFDLTRLEDIVYAIAARELKAIEVVGGVLGFVVGLAQVALLVVGGAYA